MIAVSGRDRGERSEMARAGRAVGSRSTRKSKRCAKPATQGLRTPEQRSSISGACRDGTSIAILGNARAIRPSPTRDIPTMARLSHSARTRRPLASQVLVETHWAYAVLTMLMCYSVLAATLLWSLFH